ncbi:co-chaperone GroES [Candidatus Dependentiae bacterium]|nr:co-chaperone GroES [Candidatus Dependentiae bacterium]
MANIKPLSDRILAKRLESEQTTAAGIIIPDTAQEKTQLGTAVAVGKESKAVKKDDTIIFGKYSGTEVQFDGEEYLILKEEEVLGIVEK